MISASESPRAGAGRHPGVWHDWLTPGRFALILAVCIFVSYPEVVLGSHTFVFRDFGYFGYPIAFYHRQSFWQGEIPLWNPLNLFGLPFLAQWNTLVLYPGSLFYLLFPLTWSLAVFGLAHQFLAGLSMYLLSHRWTGNRLAASVAGMAFAFNGLTLNCLMWPNNIAALGWMPLVVLFVERAWLKGGRAVPSAAVIGAMQMLAGAPELILLTWITVGVLFLSSIRIREDGCEPRQVFGAQSPSSARLGVDEVRAELELRAPTVAARSRGAFWNVCLGASVRRFFSVLLLVAGVTAIQMLPFLDLLRHSQRSSAFAADDSAMPATGWANLLVPVFESVRTAQEVYMQANQVWTSSYYTGIGVLAFAVLGAWLTRTRRAWLLAGLTVLCLVLALGDAGYLYKVLRQAVPLFGFMRYPIKFVALAIFCVSLLAGFAVHELCRSTGTDLQRARRTSITVASLLGALVLAILWFDRRYPVFPQLWHDTWWNGVTRLIFLLSILGSWWLCRGVRGTRFRAPAQGILLLLLFADIASHSPRQNPTAPRAVFRPGMVKLTPQPVPGQSRAMSTLAADMTFLHTFGSDPVNDFVVRRLGLFLNCNLLDNIPQVHGFFSLYLREPENVRALVYGSENRPLPRLYDFLGVCQMTAPSRYLEWQSRSTWLPLITAGQQPVFIDESQAFQAIQATNFSPQQVVYLPWEAKQWIHASGQTQAKIDHYEFSAQRLKFRIETSEPSVVVIAQSYYHPWRACADGRAIPVWRANYAFQGVALPAGLHEVELSYRDSFFYCGAGLALPAMLACLVGITRHRNPLLGAVPLQSPFASYWSCQSLRSTPR